MSSSYRVSREPHTRFHDHIAYVAQQGMATNSPKFCHVLQRSADALRIANRRSLSNDADEWENFPWLTMIFGSGALNLPDEFGVTADALASAVEAALEASTVHNVPGYSEQVKQWTRALVFARTGEKPGEEEAHGSDELTVDVLAAELACAAYILTQLYRLAQAHSHAPISRWDDDEVRFSQDDLIAWEGSRPPQLTPLIDDAQKLLEHLLSLLQRRQRKKDENSPILAAMATLMKETSTALDAEGPAKVRRLRIDRVRLLTEVAWYLIARDTPIYPGWTDLLLTLTLNEGIRRTETIRRARPAFPNLRQLPKAVEAIYRRPTEESWRVSAAVKPDRVGEDPAEAVDATGVKAEVARRDALYESAADVLWAQAESSASRLATTKHLPPAASFVTSFDIELDMALWVTGEGRFFRVALPVHLVKPQEPDEAELCWLMGDVYPQQRGTPDEQLALLCSPTNWRLLTPEFDSNELRAAPIVIHLSGCPLFTLPSAAKDADREDIARLVISLSEVGLEVLPDVRFEHAVTVDEYLALRQSEVELMWVGGKQNRVIPPDLLVNSINNPRFWLLMGVPVGDAAVRQRLVTQLTRMRLGEAGRSDPKGEGGLLGSAPPVDEHVKREATQEAEAGSTLSGVAVNTRIGDDETNLLFWVGLDVLEADCRDFVPDLRHYAQHVRHSGGGKIPGRSMPCDLPPEDEW